MNTHPDVIPLNGEIEYKDKNYLISEYLDKVSILEQTDQIIAIQTILRDRNITRNDFVFNADRLIRLVIEEGLNKLPYTEVEVVTPSGDIYNGLAFEKDNCGVSVIRSGEAMEKGLRDCCRSIRIGKILIQTDQETKEPNVYYAKFPPGIEKRKVLLMYPIMSFGKTVRKAVDVLKEHGVPMKNVTLLTLFCTPTALHSIFKAHPDMNVVTSSVHPIVPSNFGEKYFGTN